MISVTDMINIIEESKTGKSVKELMELKLGFELPYDVGGYSMLIQVWTRTEDEKLTFKDGSHSSLVVPVATRVEDPYRNCSGLVIMQGPECYKSARFLSGPWCNVGDWIMFPRNEGTQINYYGVPMQVIPDDRMLLRIKNPASITRGQ